MGDTDKTKAYVKAVAGILFTGFFLWAHSGNAAKCCQAKCEKGGKKCC